MFTSIPFTASQFKSQPQNLRSSAKAPNFRLPKKSPNFRSKSPKSIFPNVIPTPDLYHSYSHYDDQSNRGILDLQPSILGPRPSILGPWRSRVDPRSISLLGPRPSILGPHSSKLFNVTSFPSSQPKSFNNADKAASSKSISKKRGASLATSDDDLIFRGPGTLKKGRWDTSEILVLIDDYVEVQAFNKVNKQTRTGSNNRTLVETLKKRKRVGDDGDSPTQKLLRYKKKRLHSTGDEDFQRIELQLHNIHEFTSLFTPQSNILINSVDNVVHALCFSDSYYTLLVVFLVLSRISTKNFPCSRSSIDKKKNFGIFRDIDHEIHPLVCSCQIRLPIWLPFVFIYHSKFIKQLVNTSARATNIHESIFYVSTLRNIWVFSSVLALDDSKICCYNKFYLLYVLFLVFSSKPPSVGAPSVIMSNVEL